MDPSYVEFAAEYIYLDNLTVRLADLDRHGSYIPYLAKIFELREDKKTVDIELNDFHFSDGTKITSKDVINSFKRVIILGSPHSQPLEIFAGAKKVKSIEDNCEGLVEVSPNKLQIKTPQYVKELFYYLYLVDYSIIHPKLIKKDKLFFQDW